MRHLSNEQLRQRIEDRISEIGSQSAWARHLGVSKAFVSNVMSGHRQASSKMLSDLGLERVMVIAEKRADDVGAD